MASTGCPGVLGIACGAVLAPVDWAAPPPSGLPAPPPFWLELLVNPPRVTTVWRSRGTASMTPSTMARAAVAASSGRIHTLGDRSAGDRLEWPWAVALTSLPATRSQVSRRLGR
jgi:hypothetical protein